MREEKGITLIALVIIIIVILILAAVSMSIVLGENGVLRNSEEAVQNTKIAEVDEQAGVIASVALIEQYQGKSFKESVEEGLKSYTNFDQIPEMSADGKIATITELETGRRYNINSNYNVAYIGEDGVSTGGKGTPIADMVSVGDYIKYTPTSQNYTMTTSQTGYTSDQNYSTSSYKGEWQVLYNDAKYGVQIISSEVVGILKLQGEKGYNNLLGTLNTMAGYYVNKTYAVSGRSVGSLPSDTETSTGTEELYTNTKYAYMTKYGWNNKYKVADMNYTTDETAMKTAGLKKASPSYWLPSRSISPRIGNTSFYNFCMNYVGEVIDLKLWKVYSDGGTYEDCLDSGVRSVITLKPDILIDTSDSTKDGKKASSAWILK